MSKTITIKKSTVENYKVENSGEYASITIDSSGNKGTVQITSSFGTWSYYWGSCGVEFKKFLHGLDCQYTAGKFGEDRHFDLESTLNGFKERAKDYFTNNHDILEVKEEIKSLQDVSYKEEFISIVQHCNRIMEMECHCPDMCYIISPQFEQFWKKLWRPFVEQEFKD